jgi:hypothetical protein
MKCHKTYKRNKKAPPLVAINQVYLRLYDNNWTIAQKQIKSFLKNPREDIAIMKPALKKFGLMPKLDFDVNDRDNFAKVLIETEFKIPDWFNAHYKKHHLTIKSPNKKK